MSKASVDTSLTESLVYKAATLEIAEKIRHDLVKNFSGCWFFLYKHSVELYVTNEWGGKIKPELLKELQARAMEINAESITDAPVETRPITPIGMA